MIRELNSEVRQSRPLSGRVEARPTHNHSSTRTLSHKSMLCPAQSDTNK